MAPYWLRIEAQNLASFIFDTQDLSTARGGSLALLDVIDEVSLFAKREGVMLESITTGASTGLWRFSSPDDGKAAVVASAVRRGLASAPGVTSGCVRAARHATFRVVVMPDTSGRDPSAGTYAADDQAMTALVRRQQMASAGIVYPQTEGLTGGVCEKDRVRPAALTKRGVGISRAVEDRRHYGIENKQHFYEKRLHNRLREMGRADIAEAIGSAKAPFALQLASISEDKDAFKNGTPSLRPSLSGKVCVLYMDGNSFGDLQKEFIADGADPVQQQKQFDCTLRGYREALLAAILVTLLTQGDHGPPARGTPCEEEKTLRKENLREGELDLAGVIRFETLLWGGDEMMFVMPARFGWDIARLICEETNAWTLPFAGDPRPMHHALGMVFCHHDAPISRIQALARDLAEHAKGLTSKAVGDERATNIGRKNTFVVPAVLESFDHIGDDLSDFMDRRVQPELHDRVGNEKREGVRSERDRAFALSRDEIRLLTELTGATAGLNEGIEALPRRRLRRIANAIHRGDTAWRNLDRGLLREGPRWINKALETDSSAAFSDHFKRLGRDRAFLLIEEHRDYLMPLMPTKFSDAEA